MNSIVTYYRCLLLLLLPSFIIIALVNFSLPSTLPIIGSNGAPNNTSETTLNCDEFNVTDTRPFFERESNQTNLPRRTEKSEQLDLRRRLRSLRLVVVGCARNAEKNYKIFRNGIEQIVDLFHPSSSIFILESDSEDNTYTTYKDWQRAHVYSYGNLSKLFPRRTERIAYCRNELLEKARQTKSDYMLVVDVDIFSGNASSFLTNFDYDTSDWSAMTSNSMESYYDIWALRTISDSVINFDAWHRVLALESFKNYCRDSIIRNTIEIHKKHLPPDQNLIEVRSAFNGAGLYKMEATQGCYYFGEAYTCEHVPFHICMREKNQAKLYINPKFIIE